MSHNLIPLFWREADDGVRKVLDAATESIDDLFLDIDTRYKALKIEDCPDYKPELFRPMYVYVLVNEDGIFDTDLWGKLTNYQKRYFQNAYFIWPDKELDPEAEVDDRKWMCLQEMSWCRTIYCGGYIENGVDFETSVEEVSTEKNQITFYRDPFITFDAKWQDTEITTPWRKTYPCRMLTLWVSDLTMSESVLDTHYADLVMDKDSQKVFRSTGAYSAFVYNFYKVLYQGATVLGLCGFVNSISNYDCIKSDWETIEAVYFESVPDGEPGEMRRVIATDKNKYYLPMDIQPGSWLEMGKSYPKFTPIAEVVQVLTYLEDPDWPFSAVGGVVEDVVVTVEGSDKPNSTFDFSYNNTPPRFDFCRLYERHPASHPESSHNPGSTVFQYGMQSLEEGLWHNVVGPNLVVINFLDVATYNLYGEQFGKLLKEIAPIHVYCSVTTNFSGWFFYDDEEDAWFTDEEDNFIEDPEF